MPVNKTAEVKKVKAGLASKNATGPKKLAVAKPKAKPAPVALKAKAKAAPAAMKAKPAPVAKKVAIKKVATTKAAITKAAPKKLAGPRLTDPQQNMLKKVVAHTGAEGYHPAKVENKVLESLLKHKLVKKGKKHPETKLFHYQVSTIGKKHLEVSAKS